MLSHGKHYLFAEVSLYNSIYLQTVNNIQYKIYKHLQIIVFLKKSQLLLNIFLKRAIQNLQYLNIYILLSHSKLSSCLKENKKTRRVKQINFIAPIHLFQTRHYKSSWNKTGNYNVHKCYDIMHPNWSSGLNYCNWWLNKGILFQHTQIPWTILPSAIQCSADLWHQ